jgi:heat-inducible transcriptional repressor
LECAVVVAPYTVEGERAGTIGILGPTRMNYSQALAAVATVSQRLGKTLAEG